MCWDSEICGRFRENRGFTDAVDDGGGDGFGIKMSRKI